MADRLATHICPFSKNECTKVEKGSSIPTGVCSVSAGASKTPVIICRERLIGDWMATLRVAASESFGAPRFIAGGSKLDMAYQLTSSLDPAVVAYRDVVAMGKKKITFEWILQHYDYHHQRRGFLAAQILPGSIVGNYKAALLGYRNLHSGGHAPIQASEHRLDWSHLSKKVIPDIIQRGVILAQTESCWGNYLILPDVILEKLEPFFAGIGERAQIASHILSIRAYTPDSSTASGVRATRAMNLAISDIASAFYARADEKAASSLEVTLSNIL